MMDECRRAKMSTEDLARSLIAFVHGVGLTLPRRAKTEPKVSEVAEAIEGALSPLDAEKAGDVETVQIVEAGLKACGYSTRGLYAFLRMRETRSTP
jgi:hypothetical protein